MCTDHYPCWYASLTFLACTEAWIFCAAESWRPRRVSQSRPSGSLCRARGDVLMADGSTKDVSQIEEGDIVFSPTIPVAGDVRTLRVVRCSCSRFRSRCVRSQQAVAFTRELRLSRQRVCKVLRQPIDSEYHMASPRSSFAASNLILRPIDPRLTDCAG